MKKGITIQEERIASAGHNWYMGTIAIDPCFPEGDSFTKITDPIVNKHKGYSFKELRFNLGGLELETLGNYPVEIIISDENEEKSVSTKIDLGQLLFFSNSVDVRIMHTSDFIG